ncbi:hypothetical protein ACHAQA_003130 [Verticillium albo-atrum]
MRSESGVQQAAASFHANLPLERMRCDFMPNLPASWFFKQYGNHYKLSKAAAEVLTTGLRLKWDDLKRYDVSPIIIENRRWDPVTATASSVAEVGTGMVTSAADIIVKPIQAFTKHSSEKKLQRAGTSSSATSALSDSTVDGKPTSLDVPSASTSWRKMQGQAPIAEAVLGSASGVGGFFKHYSKGVMLDLPLAVTEGLRNAPGLYGGEVYNPGAVTDWKSGSVAAGKNFAHGMVEGMGGLVISPIRGARKEGAVGALKGVGVGLLNMGTKFSSGVLGLVALPGHGVYQSVRATIKRDTRRKIKEARRMEGSQVVKPNGRDGMRINEGQILRTFDKIMVTDREAAR